MRRFHKLSSYLEVPKRYSSFLLIEREITAEQLIQHYENTWNGRFAQVADLEEILKED